MKLPKNKKKILFVLITLLVVYMGYFFFYERNAELDQKNEQKETLQSSNELDLSSFPTGVSTEKVTEEMLKTVFGFNLKRNAILPIKDEYIFKINDENQFEYKTIFTYNQKEVVLVGYNFNMSIDSATYENKTKISDTYFEYKLLNAKALEYKPVNEDITFHLIDYSNSLSTSKSIEILEKYVRD